MSEIWNRYVMNGEAYSAENFIIPGGGFIGNIQLFNPLVPGTKRIRLRSCHMTSALAQGGAVNRNDVVLTTLGLPAGFVVENLLSSIAPGSETAVMGSQASVASLGALFWQLSAAGGEPALYPPGGREWGFDLLPGQGISLNGALSATIIVNWQWVEIPL